MNSNNNNSNQKFNTLEYKKLIAEMFPSKYSLNNVRQYEKQIANEKEDSSKDVMSGKSSKSDNDSDSETNDSASDSGYTSSSTSDTNMCIDDETNMDLNIDTSLLDTESAKEVNTIKRKAFDLISTCNSGKVFKNIEILLDPNPKSKLRLKNKDCNSDDDDDDDDSEDSDYQDDADEDEDYDDDALDEDQDEDQDEDDDDYDDNSGDDAPGITMEISDKQDTASTVERRPSYTHEDFKVLSHFTRLASETKDKLKKSKQSSRVLDEMLDFANKQMSVINKEKQEKKRIRRNKRENMKKFSSFIKNKRKLNDFSAFAEYSIEKQQQVLEKLEAIKRYDCNENPQRIALLDTDIPVQYKAVALRKMNMLDTMEPGSNEHYKLKQWVDSFMRIPFNKYSNLPLTISDGVEKTHEFMSDSMKILNEAVYGLNDAKIQIMQMIGQWITNPSALGTAISIQGPMGTGKTTLVKDGISKILGRDFAFIALGGATDSSVLEGHSYTYEGSTWGKIVDILLQGKTMNPVIYFDELDKISNTPKGEEIAHILTHLTDTTQNNQFHDKYFSEIELDLSRCLFIFSYNEEEKVNPILRDRMYKITTAGYSVKEKITIVNNYLLPKIIKEINFSKEDVEFEDSVLRYIIEKYTNDEKGVRNLKRCLETIYRKLNLFKLMKPDENLFENDIAINVTFPLKLTNIMVDKFIKTTNDKDNTSARFMYL